MAFANLRGRPQACDHERVLSKWAKDGANGPDLAREHGVTVSCIHTIVRRARAAGDPRAVRKPATNRSAGNWTAFFVRCRVQGLDVGEMARIARMRPCDVRKRLASHDLRTAR